MWKKVLSYFQEGLWNFHLSEKQGWERSRIKFLRIVYLSGRNFILDNCAMRSSALTFFTLMSIVPILALAFAIAKGFGFHEHLHSELLSRFSDQQTVLTEFIEFANRMLDQTKGGVIALVGLAILFWTVAKLLANMESALNHIWNVKKMRSWQRVISDYFALMLIAPLVFLIFSTVSLFIIAFLKSFMERFAIGQLFSPAIQFLIDLLPYALFWIFFTFIYLFMPNTKVRLKSAVIGGAVGGILYVLMQWVYIFFQVGVARYGAIYGSFAALPLFLVWVQLSWYVLLYGAEVAAADQYVKRYEFESAAKNVSLSYKALLSLWVVYLCTDCYLEKKKPLSFEVLVQRYQIPFFLAEQIIEDLVKCSLVVEVKKGKALGYIPAISPEGLKISDVVERLQNEGVRDLPVMKTRELTQLTASLQAFQVSLKNLPENQMIKDIGNGPSSL